MGTEKQRAELDQLAHRQAFESYLRRGRAPAPGETADGEQKSRDRPRPRFSKKALGDERPTNHYIWRTARDERVRSFACRQCRADFRLDRPTSHRTSGARTQLPLLTLRNELPLVYGNLNAEISLPPEDPREARYGERGTTRLDILEVVTPSLVCVYDIKTGRSGLSFTRVQTIAKRVAAKHPGAIFYIIEVRPFE